MGLGPPIIALYHQLKQLGAFEGVRDVVELGSQNVWCPQRRMIRELFRAFGCPEPTDRLLDDFASWRGSARDLYEGLGMRYACVDVDEQFNSVTLDMNFDGAPAEHVGRYDLLTNHGTSEHVLNQANLFRLCHDLTKTGGLMLHAVTFTVHLEHGFFNYQPAFFDALARANGYESLGTWVGPDWQLTSLVPWDPSLVEYLSLSSKTTHLLVVLQRKTSDAAFRAPAARIAPDAASAGSRSPYCTVVDGELYEGNRLRFVTANPVRLGEHALPARRQAPLPRNEVRQDDGGAAQAEPAVAALPLIAALKHLRATGLLDGAKSAIELGARPIESTAGAADALRALGVADSPHTTSDLLRSFGLEASALALDLNHDSVPAEQRETYDLVANVGTSAFLLNQLNAFQAAHDLVKPGGLMLHVVPFTVQLEKAFFGYQPNYFEALARYNSYRTLAFWLGVDEQSPALIPWQPSVLDYLTLSAKTTHVLVVVLQKMYPTDFCVPFQVCYESMIPKKNLARYRVVVDGRYVDAVAAMQFRSASLSAAPVMTEAQARMALSAAPGIELVRELGRRVKARLATLMSGRVRDALAKPIDTRTQG